MIHYEQIPLGSYQANCYLITNQTNRCIIIDPGDEGTKLIEFIKERNLQPIAILLTHAHSDHIGALDVVRDTYQIPAYIHQNEEHWLYTPSLNGSDLDHTPFTVRKAEKVISEKGDLSIEDFTFIVLETPGHSPGSISFYFPDDGYLFSGDLLFKRGIGRTDFLGGNSTDLMNSIQHQLFKLPEDTIILPGHGPHTTINEERTMNPFFKTM